MNLKLVFSFEPKQIFNFNRRIEKNVESFVVVGIFFCLLNRYYMLQIMRTFFRILDMFIDKNIVYKNSFSLANTRHSVKDSSATFPLESIIISFGRNYR